MSASQKELREAFEAGADFGQTASFRAVVVEAKRRFPPKLITRPRVIQLPSREPASIAAKYRYVNGALEFSNHGYGWIPWLNVEDTIRLKELFFNSTETIEVDE